MPEKIAELLKEALAAAQKDGVLPEFEVADFGIERPQDVSHGEWTSTVALRCARLAKMPPKKIADVLVEHLPQDASIKKTEVAGPGFINFYLSVGAATEIFQAVRQSGRDFGKSNVGKGERILVEFVSANPVGPMHVGHGRWTALGDSLCRVLRHTNYQVMPEFYINDHGSQMNVFGSSIAKRYEQLAEIMDKEGTDLEGAYAHLVADRDNFVQDEADLKPDSHPYMDAFSSELGGNAYGGTYIIDLARDFYTADGDRWLKVSEDERVAHFREKAYHQMVSDMRQICHEARCDFDRWFSEDSLYQKDESGTCAVERAFAQLERLGHLYRSDDGALWFRTSTFGDDKDRVIIKSNGEYTYFASDVAYHWDKFQRADYAVDILGCDHHGYIKRVQASCDALGYPGKFEVLLGQFVNLLRNGEPLRMSKRKGIMITFRELMDEVGPDAVRYTLISRSSTQPIDFDLEAVKEKNASNPVYYVQYAHARICSILRKAASALQGDSHSEAAVASSEERPVAAADESAEAAKTPTSLEVVAGESTDEARKLANLAQTVIGEDVDLSLLTDPSELNLARKLSEFTELVASCARDRAPFRLTHYAQDLAADFHAFYTNCQVLSSKAKDISPELSRARLVVCDAVRIVLALTLELIGVSAPVRM